MVYVEARVAALDGKLQSLQGEIDHELELPTPDVDRLADFKHRIYRIKEEIGLQRTKLASAM